MTTTTPTTTFIQDFHTWRKSQIKTNYTTSSTVDVTTLTAEKFIALTTFKDVTDTTTNTTKKKDIVKTEADIYLINLVLYHMSETGLKVVDATKPTLTSEILNTFQNDTGYTEALTKYANLWLLSSIHDQCTESKRTSYVKNTAVETDFKTLQSGKPMTNINMRLTFIATAKKCADFIPYMYNSDTMIAKVQTYLLEETYRKTWVETAFNEIKVKPDDSTFDDNVRFMELKSKLDILDPSLNLSSTVLNEYYSHLYVLTSPSIMKKGPKIHKAFKRVTTDALKKIIAKPEHPYYSTVTQAKTLFKGKIAPVSGNISRCLFKIHSGKINTTAPDAQSVMSFDSATFINKMSKKKSTAATENTEITALWKTDNMYRLASSIFVMCNAASIYAALMSYNKETTLDKVLEWVDKAVDGVDAVTSVAEAVNANYKVYTWVASRVTKLLKPTDGPILSATATSNAAKYAKYFKVATRIGKYITAALAVVSMAFTIYDMVTGIQNQDWGMVAISAVEFALEFGLFIITFITATSWSGPVSLILTGILIVIAIIKIFWDQIKQFFHNILKAIDTFFTGDPAVKFVTDSEAKYHITIEEIDADMLIQIDAYEVLHPDEKVSIQRVRSQLTTQ